MQIRATMHATALHQRHGFIPLKSADLPCGSLNRLLCHTQQYCVPW